MSFKVSPASEIDPEDAACFEINIYTLARKLHPEADTKLCFPCTLKINVHDTPQKIDNNFKEKYGYSLDRLMVEPDSWENGPFGDDPKLVERRWELPICRRKNMWVLDEEGRTIEVRMQTRQLS